MSTSHRILLVEDDADDRYIMHLAFTELSYTEQVKVFNSGDDILRYLHNLPHSDLYPSLLVIDFNMPGMNGGELLMRLKMDDMLQDIPVAMYSTGMRNLEQKLKTLGADYCFEKGNQIGEVYALAEKLKSIVDGNEVVEKN
ncbi:MAG: response regulator [Chitinophagaceae bacterium]|nr:MAG: response regulator [Chitinophagaceae bacterium]